METVNIANGSSSPGSSRQFGSHSRRGAALCSALLTALSCTKENKHSDVCSCTVYICLAPILHTSTEHRAMATQKTWLVSRTPAS